MHDAVSQRALAVANGVDPTPLIDANSPAPAPAPVVLPLHQPFLSSEERIEGIRLSFGSHEPFGFV